MKKLCMILMFWLAVVVYPSIGEASSTPQVKVTTSQLNVKSEAQANSKTVLQLSKGSLVIVTATEKGFSKISYNGRTGYITTAGLKATTPTPKVVTRAQGLVVKSAPTSTAKTSTTLQVKSIVEDYGKVNANYHLVQYGSVIGYAHKSALKATKPTTRYINGEAVTIYAAANAKSTKRNKLAFGTTVKVHSTIGSWSYVTAGSKRGYISKSFLVSKKPVKLKGVKESYSNIKSDIRYSTTLRDLKGNTVTAHFIALWDSYKIASWDGGDIWAGANEGDHLYQGDYQLALQLKGSKDVYFQPFTFNSYTYNKSAQLIYRIKGKTAKDTDFLAVSEVWSSAARGAKLYYYQHGQLKATEEIGYFLKPKSIGNQQYQSANYARDEVTGYIFFTEKFNPATGKFTIIKRFPFFDDLWNIGSAHAEKFSTIADYYVK